MNKSQNFDTNSNAGFVDPLVKDYPDESFITQIIEKIVELEKIKKQ